jgi:hypothetical protein
MRDMELTTYRMFPKQCSNQILLENGDVFKKLLAVWGNLLVLKMEATDTLVWNVC